MTSGGAHHPRLVLFPGLGADARLFDPQRRAFPHLEIPAWIEPESGESLGSFGRRMAARLGPGPRPFLGGVSFGGMVALEAARHVDCRGVFLIGSCRSGHAIPGALRTLEEASRLLPDSAVEAGRALSPLFLGRLGTFDAAQKELMLDMFRTIPTSFFRWAIHALMDWTAADLPCPVHHIHGSDDQIIPVSLVKPDRLVEGGGHLINMTHADEVNRFMLEGVHDHSRGRQSTGS